MAIKSIRFRVVFMVVISVQNLLVLLIIKMIMTYKLSDKKRRPITDAAN